MRIQQQSDHPPYGRRGVVLILVLGLLALLALIGVTFATFASQSRIGARNFAQSVNAPGAADMMDYALSQLINDTDNSLSAIRGHSLKRDMYGSDAAGNGLLTSTVNGPLRLTGNPGGGATYNTNIPYDGSTSFVGWILKLAPTTAGFDANGNPAVVRAGVSPTMQSFVVVGDLAGGSGGYHQFVLSATDSTTRIDDVVNGRGPSRLIQPADAATGGAPFILDGRYRFAFNGPGVDGAYGSNTNPNPAQFANYRFNGDLLAGAPSPQPVPGAPGLYGMDEDYDACDLENWFLAIQSADGNVVVPSFHRPGILTAADWSSASAASMSKILRPRWADHGANNPFGNGVENVVPGSPITFDVDNDGDGKTDSVWLDLGYPPRRNAQGRLYKPLFAFMVIGLNGRIPLNTAGNLAGRDDNGDPLAGQTTHLGNSVSEVDPTYALQNAHYNTAIINPFTNLPYGQYDDSGRDTNGDGVLDSGADVRTTQLQNLLAGTRPIPPEVLSANPALFYPNGNIVSGAFTGPTRNFGDANHAPLGMDSLGNVLRYYMPNGVVDPSDMATDGTHPIPPASLATSLVARLASMPAPVAGRWGEASSISGLKPAGSSSHVSAPWLTERYNNPARAGYSLGGRDVDDDNLNTFDPYRLRRDATHFGEVGDSDLYDSSNSPMLPVERMRRFVTPVDLDGSGRVAQWNGSSGSAGADSFGRVAFMSYFRPPGLPSRIATDVTTGVISLPFDAATGNPAADYTNNPLHGFDFFRFPALYSSAPGSGPQRLGGMPSNQQIGSDVSTTGTKIPTYNSSINSGLATDGHNDADEMNLYAPSRHDQPFGPSDLEWLYRRQDVDGAALSSRLAQLAPVSFTNIAPILNPLNAVNVIGGDSLRRRRLFSIDSWELNNYIWANDNPRGAFTANSRFKQTDDAGFGKIQSNTTGLAAIWGTNDPLGAAPYMDPALAHRNKKINLNLPLPVSNDPNEPVRRKWITNAYYLLKAVLPPKAVDTPEELAQLSQFLVNVVDFRDPDATLTHFVNPDVFFRPAVVGGSPVLVAASAKNPATDAPLDQYGMEYCPIAINEVFAYSYQRKEGAAPVASNRFFIELVNTLTDSALSPAAGTSLYPFNLGGELTPTINPTNPWSNGCWDLIFTDDSPQARPDPFRGQLPPATGTGLYGLTPLSKIAMANSVSPTLPPVPLAAKVAYSSPNTTTSSTPALPTNYFYVIGSQPATANNSDGSTSEAPASIAATQPLLPTYDPVDQTAPPSGSTALGPGILPTAVNSPTPVGAYPPKLPQPTAAQSKYYWVCLRRPANPFMPVSVDNPMVVVDSMRFAYTEGGGTGKTDPATKKDTVTPGTNALYSAQRLQPFRGGHAVLAPGGGFDWRYGYSEQIAEPKTPTGNVSGTYGTDGTQASGSKKEITTLFYHTIGTFNDPAGFEEPWDYFPFNDRDFTSPAELLLVPGCPPGLFTKQFVELAVTAPNLAYLSQTASASAGAPTVLNKTPTAGGAASYPFVAYPSSTLNPAKSYPYLVDKFFYSSPNTETISSASNMVDNQTSAGWYKMFDVFEVPSQSMGAYGPVAQGSNFDWFRQDVRPGLVNLNLIIDEEVFLSVFGKQNSKYVQTLLDFTVPPPPVPTVLPIVTGLDPSGTPMVNPVVSTGFSDTNNGGVNTLKPAFMQFLKLRHGGSGNLFGYGSGAVGTATAAERPFRSFSHPDVNQTIMRPATLPPIVTTVNPSGAATQTAYLATPAGAFYEGDPGLKNPLLYPGYTSGTSPLATTRVLPPAIPARRLFQPPDSARFTISNAGVVGDPLINRQISTGSSDAVNVPPNPPNMIAAAAQLGSAGNGTADTSRHPYFRTEMLQKVMNLTTVRTHQYAVWITVGFFEVTRPGNPDLAGSAPALAYDQLGREIGLNGKIVRFRGFYVVDRTRATGFNPADPGDPHDCVVYGHVIQ